MSTTTTTPVPVNLNKNIVTIVLVMGVSVAVTLIFALAKLIPKLRSGEVSFSKIEFDWRAELLNQTPKKEKERQAAERARRQEELAARQNAGSFQEAEAQQYHQNEPLSPHVATVTTEKGAHVDVFVPENERETR